MAEVSDDVNKGKIIVIGSRPKISKSFLSINIINRLIEKDYRVLYFDFKVPKKILKNKMEKQNKVEIIDTPNLEVKDIKEICKKKYDNTLKLIVIDYIQLIKDYNSVKNRLHVIEVLDCLTRELNIPILILYSLSKDIELRENKIPILNDIKPISLVDKASRVVFLYEDKNKLKADIYDNMRN